MVSNRKRIHMSDDSYPSFSEHHPKRMLQSSVVLPAIETKSRAAIITELKSAEKKEDKLRNRRMFSNLIVGTLNQFQKDESKVNGNVQAQMDKQKEIERRMELIEKENREKILKEKQELQRLRREKEQEFLRQKRIKTIQQIGEEKEKHFRRLQCFIQTQTKPPIFFLPAKHTLRTLELLKESAKKVDGLIEISRHDMERELQRHEHPITNSEDEDDAADLPVGGLKSAVVSVKHSPPPPTPIVKEEDTISK